MVRNGANVNGGFEVTGRTPLMAAADMGHEKVVEVLAKNGADVNIKSSGSHESPLFIAAWDGTHEHLLIFTI